MKEDTVMTVTEKAVALATSMIESNMAVFLDDLEKSKAENSINEADMEMIVKIPVSIKENKLCLSAKVEWTRKKKRNDETDNVWIDPDQPELDID